jgi:hypothetical protein
MAAAALTLVLTPLAATGANGDPIVVGGNHAGSATTMLSNTANTDPVFWVWGLGNALEGRSGGRTAVYGESSGSGASAIGVHGLAHNDGTGVDAWSDGGVGLKAGSADGTGLFALSTNGPGGILMTQNGPYALSAHDMGSNVAIEATSDKGTALQLHADHGQALWANASVGGKPAVFAANQAAKSGDAMPTGIWGFADDGVGVQGNGKYQGGGFSATLGFGVLGSSQGPLGNPDTDPWHGVGVLGVTENGVGVGAFSAHGVGVRATTSNGTALEVGGRAAFESAGLRAIPAGQSSVTVGSGGRLQLREGDMILVTLMGDPSPAKKRGSVWFSHVVPDYANHAFDVVLTGPAGRATPFAYFVISAPPSYGP